MIELSNEDLRDLIRAAGAALGNINIMSEQFSRILALRKRLEDELNSRRDASGRAP